jgi:hypothetical protein
MIPAQKPRERLRDTSRSIENVVRVCSVGTGRGDQSSANSPGLSDGSRMSRTGDTTMSCKPFVLAILAVTLSFPGPARAQDSGPYKVLKIQLVGGDGGFDYVTADPDGRNLYAARSGPDGHIGVYNLDTLAQVGDIPGVSAHGGAVDTSTGHGFATSKPVTMFDSKTFAILKKIDVQGNPDGTSTTLTITISTSSATRSQILPSLTIRMVRSSAPPTSVAHRSRPLPTRTARSMSTSKTRPPSQSSTRTP